MARAANRRVVIENADGLGAVAQGLALHQAGFDVAICGGPELLAGHRCPVVEGERCALLEDADVVVHDLDVDEAQGREVLAAIRGRYPDLPVVLELPTEVAQRHSALLAGCHVTFPFDMDHLVEVVAGTFDPAP
jgi:CheY-like chemotaxis protein